MARTRLLHPEFFLNEELGELTPAHAVLFAGLWTLADREGRLEDRPGRIKLQVLPWWKADVNALLLDLHRAGFIQRYVAAGDGFISICKFLKYQKPHLREKPSTIPAPPLLGTAEHDLGSAKVGAEHDLGSAKPGVSVSVSVSDPVSVSVSVSDPEAEVFGHWAKKLNHPRAVLDDKRRKLIREQLKLGTVDDLKRAVDGVLVDMQAWPDRQRFDGIEYVFENRASVEKFLDLAIKGNPAVRAKDGYYRAEDSNKNRPPPGIVHL